MRILHIGKFFPPHHGGMEVFLADLIAEQQAQGLEVAAIVHGDPLPDDPAWLTRVQVQVQLIYAPIALGFRSALDRVIKKFKPDILHLHMPNTSAFWVLTLASARSLPWVAHWHSDVVASKLGKGLALAYKAYRPFEQAVLDLSEVIIATSPPYLEASEPLSYWRSKCEVVPLGLAFKKQNIQTSDLESAQKFWRPSRLRLLSIGRLSHYKGFDTLISAVAGLPGVDLLIVGNGEMASCLKTLLDRLPPGDCGHGIKLLGAVDDETKRILLTTCDAFCLASCERTEAFGLVLLEAMAHGKPCLVSDLAGSGMPWVVREAGVGICIQTGAVDRWRLAIVHTRDNKSIYKEMGRNGIHFIENLYSIERCAASLSRVYSKIIYQANNQKPKNDPLVIIPAKNEAQTIGNLLRDLQQSGWANIVVIDDQSKDATGEIASACGAVVLKPVLPLGAWGATQTGIRFALSEGYQAVVTMDADGQHEVAEITALSKATRLGDVIVGAYPARASSSRKLAWNWFNRLTRLNLGDLTSGFRYYNHKAMVVLASEEASLLDYQDVGTLLMIRRSGLSIEEVPVKMNERLVGQSRIFSSWMNVFIYMARTTLLCIARVNIEKNKCK